MRWVLGWSEGCVWGRCDQVAWARPRALRFRITTNKPIPISVRTTGDGSGMAAVLVVRVSKQRCEARALAPQLKRTQESTQEIESFRAGGELILDKIDRRWPAESGNSHSLKE